MTPKFNCSKKGCFIILAIVLPWLFATQCPAASQNSDLSLPARIVLSKAVKALNQKAYDEAIQILSAFQARGGAFRPEKADPKGYHHAEVYFVLGTCYLFKKNYQQAVSAFERALKKDPGHISAWLNLAKTHYDLNQYAKSAKCFIKAYDNASEKNPEHLYYGAAAYLMARLNKASITVFERLLKKHPEAFRPAWREHYVQALLADGRARRALPHIRQLAEQYSGKKQIQWQEILLHQYMQLKMDKEARAYVRFLTRQAPTLAKWWKALAHINLQDGDYESGLTALIICGFLRPLSDQETKLLADLHLQLGIPVRAAPLYEAALRKKNDPRMLNNLVLSLRQLGQLEQALDVIDRFAPHGKAGNLLMLKADLLYSLKRYKEAQKTYFRVTRLIAPQTAQKGRAWLMAGYAALQANDVEAGRHAFKQAATFKRQRKDALSAIRLLQQRRKQSCSKQPEKDP